PSPSASDRDEAAGAVITLPPSCVCVSTWPVGDHRSQSVLLPTTSVAHAYCAASTRHHTWHSRPGPVPGRRDHAGEPFPARNPTPTRGAPAGAVTRTAPPWGRRPLARQAGLPSVHLHIPGRPPGGEHRSRCLRLGSPCLGSPAAAGRAWVPGCHARTHQSLTPFYDGSAQMHRPRRYRFAISIDRPVHMPPSGTPAGTVLDAPKFSTGH